MAYVNLRERRSEEQRRGAGWFRRGLVRAPYLLLVAGLLFVIPAMAASYTAFVQAPPDSCVALLYWIPPTVLLFWAWRHLRRPRGQGVRSDFGAEKLLLLAIRDARGAITPVRAALETPLTVDEADVMLSKLATAGHLHVESHDGTLYYVLPPDLPPSGPLGRG